MFVLEGEGAGGRTVGVQDGWMNGWMDVALSDGLVRPQFSLISVECWIFYLHYLDRASNPLTL